METFKFYFNGLWINFGAGGFFLIKKIALAFVQVVSINNRSGSTLCPDLSRVALASGSCYRS